MYTLVKIIPNKSTMLFKGKIGPKKKKQWHKRRQKRANKVRDNHFMNVSRSNPRKGRRSGSHQVSHGLCREQHNGSSFSKLNPRRKEEFVSVRFNKQNEVSAGFFELFQDDWMWSCDQNRGVRVPSCFLHLKERFVVFMCRDGSTFGKNSSPTLQDTSSGHLQMFPQLLWGTQLWFRT